MKKYLFLIIVVIVLIGPSNSKSEEFTQKDREILIRLETKAEEGQKALQRQIDDLKDATEKRIDDLRILLLWGFGILFGGMGILIGFVIWDRRTALEPVAKKYRELEEEGEKYKKALKEYAKVEPKLAEVLKSLNLL